MKVNIYNHSRSKIEPTHKVTAIVPNYNYAAFIVERLDSILFQTYPISELVILDDASTDDSVQMIKQKVRDIRTDYPEIEVKFIPNKRNSGGCVFSQWQRGVAEASGEFIWIAEADDSCHEKFLETVIAKFDENPKTVLCYTDSCRINQKNEVKSRTCSDWADMWRSGRYSEDFYNDGKDEIKNYLSGTNPIMNVSSVVWKNADYLPKLFEEAKSYKVAGDWYIYSKVLEYGDIAYSAKPLNYYRKHDQGSASTVVKLNVEYGEVVAVQESIAKRYKLSKELLEWQKVRRRGMGFVENTKNVGKKGTIAWLVPWFDAGSGGHRTIFTTINRLIEHGYCCDMYVDSLKNEYPNEIYQRLVDDYGKFDGEIFTGYQLARKYDMIVATGWDTAKAVSEADCPRKLYFIQDFEPCFFPMGSEYLTAEQSYNYGLKGITIGRWLSQKIGKNYKTNTDYFNFCADLEIYHKIKNQRKEKAICLICQPGKPRRCDKIALRALQLVQRAHPEVKIYLYGSPRRKVHNLSATHLSIITAKKCNELYNKCAVGLCMSASNPSRIPFEMMAAGIPVVELYRENNLYDLPEDGCLLAEPTPAAIATALEKILEDEALQKKMGEAGAKFMKDYPIERGYKQFLKYVDERFADKPEKNAGLDIEPSYKRKSVTASEKMARLDREITKKVVIGELPMVADVVKLSFSRRAMRKVKRLVKKTINFIREA